MTQTQALTTTDGADRVLEVLVTGNLSVLTPPERVDYFNRVCDSLRLNPMTKPFEFITLNGKLTLYATKACTDQLRQIHGVSINIEDQRQVGDLYMVTVTATDKSGRQDSDMGVVTTKNLAGENLANAMLKTVTKAKRRVTLSICGLGMLDETEVEDIPASAKRPPVAMPRSRRETVDTVTGEIVEEAQRGPVPAPAGRAPSDSDDYDRAGEPAWSATEFSELLKAATLTVSDLRPLIGPVTRDNWQLAVTAWLIANPDKGIRDLIAEAVPPAPTADAEQGVFA